MWCREVVALIWRVKRHPVLRKPATRKAIQCNSLPSCVA